MMVMTTMTTVMMMLTLTSRIHFILKNELELKLYLFTYLHFTFPTAYLVHLETITITVYNALDVYFLISILGPLISVSYSLRVCLIKLL